MLHTTSEKRTSHAAKSSGIEVLERKNIKASSALLKAISNENRLMMLILLRGGEKSVQEIGSALKLRQPTVSQHLARLRDEGLVQTRRQGQAIYYSISSTKAKRVIDLLRRLHS